MAARRKLIERAIVLTPAGADGAAIMGLTLPLLLYALDAAEIEYELTAPSPGRIVITYHVPPED